MTSVFNDVVYRLRPYVVYNRKNVAVLDGVKWHLDRVLVGDDGIRESTKLYLAQLLCLVW